jgi:gliding motility-associated-like protein
MKLKFSKLIKHCIMVLFTSVMVQYGNQVQAQYNTAGSAQQTAANCFSITGEIASQAGAIWNVNQIDLNNPFDISLTLNFGNITNDDWNNPPCGADGMSFILQPFNTGQVGVGGQVGFGGITPSLGVIMDTYTNGPDDNITYDGGVDHISINKNGDALHYGTGNSNELSSPLSSTGFPANLEDGLPHSFRAIWLPSTHMLMIFFDGIQVISYTGDIVNNIFGGNPYVYWGIGGATGMCYNNQTVCVNIAADFSANNACAGQTVTFTNQSISGLPIATYSWDFGDGNGSNLANPTHQYATPGIYNATLTVTNNSGLTSTIGHPVVVSGPVVTASANTNVSCPGLPVTLNGTVTPVPPSYLTPLNFSNSNSVAIPDGGVTSGWTGSSGSFASSTINVTGLNSGWILSNICININHTYIGDLIVYLKDPCGNLIALTNGNGGGGINFSNTCFSPTASIDINSGTAPFSSGPYIPFGGSGVWTAVQNCATPNGTWTLLAGDMTSSDAGTLISWSLGFSNPTTVTCTYNWTTINNSTSLSPVVNPTATTTYTLTGTDMNGCSSSASVTVAVNPLNTPTPSSNSPVCAGAALNLSVNSYTAATYTWAGPNGFSSTQQNPVINPVSIAATGDYTVTVSLGGSCSSSAIVSASVYSAAVPSVTSNSPICEGSDLTLNAQSPTALSYSWSGPGNFSSTQQNPVITAIPATGSGTYTVTVTEAGGCTASSATLVSINAAPALSFPAPASLCGDSPAVTLNMATPAGGTYSGTGVSNNWFDPAVSGTGTFTILYQYTDNSGCSNSASASMVVYPVPQVSISPQGISVCAGNPVQLAATGAQSYTWAASPYLNQLTGSIVTAFPQTTSTYGVTGSNYGCTASAMTTIMVNSLPTLNFSASPTEGCEPLDVRFSYMPDHSISDSSWTWNFGDGSPVSEDTGVVHTYQHSGIYQVRLTARSTEGCYTTAMVLITVNPNPVADFTPHSEILMAENPHMEIENNTINASIWQWNFGDPASYSANYSAEEEPYHDYSGPGNYTITLLASNQYGCTDTASRRIIVRNPFVFWVPSAFTPNSNGLNDYFGPQGTGIIESSFEMRIFNRWGEELYFTRDLNAPWDGRDQKGKMQPTGVYIYQIYITDEVNRIHTLHGTVTIL